jgi:hypothetical protein
MIFSLLLFLFARTKFSPESFASCAISELRYYLLNLSKTKLENLIWLAGHLGAVNPMAKNYKCTVCGRAFVSKKELDAHTKKAHPVKTEGKKAAPTKTEQQPQA